MEHITDFEDLLVDKYGKKGTVKRDKFDADSLAFRLGVMLKEARKEANLTQEELAEKTGTKKKLHLENRERLERYSNFNLLQTD